MAWAAAISITSRKLRCAGADYCGDTVAAAAIHLELNDHIARRRNHRHFQHHGHSQRSADGDVWRNRIAHGERERRRPTTSPSIPPSRGSYHGECRRWQRYYHADSQTRQAATSFAWRCQRRHFEYSLRGDRQHGAGVWRYGKRHDQRRQHVEQAGRYSRQSYDQRRHYAASPPGDTLFFNDAGQTANQTYTFTDTTLTRSGLPNPIKFNTVETLETDSGAGNDKFVVNFTTYPVSPATDDEIRRRRQPVGGMDTLRINGTGGNDTIKVGTFASDQSVPHAERGMPAIIRRHRERHAPER